MEELRSGLDELQERAQEEGILRPLETSDFIIAALLFALTGSGDPSGFSTSAPPLATIATLDPPQVAAMREWVDRTYRRYALKTWAQYQAGFEGAASRLAQKAAVEGWTKAQFSDAFETLADGWGRSGFGGAIADTWYRTKVVATTYHQLQDKVFLAEPTRRLYPYREHIDMQDGRVRINHRFHGFIARSTWPRWPIFLPPLGWNCRCRNRFISWIEARARGLNTALDFPSPGGLFRLIGKGPDPGF